MGEGRRRPSARPPEGRPLPEAPRGRFAPSPTGGLHLGRALVALAAWLSVRSRGGTLVWRVEDLDGPRAVPGAAEQQMEEARWLGLDWDEGPGCGGPNAPYWQSERSAHYEAALQRLAEAGRLFPCRRSRRDLAALATAPHGHGGLPPYPARWRPRRLPSGWFEAHQAAARPDAALRFRVDEAPVTFEDRVQGTVTEDVAATVGDVVLQRRDGVFAYQLAVVVDDLAMGITEVVRGADLLDSTARQVQLVQALGGTPPAYAHLPLAVNAAGEKLSKRDGSLTLSALRDGGSAPQAVVGWLAHALGLLDAPRAVPPAALVAAFAWARVQPMPIVVPDDLPGTLRALVP
ncbi:MAG: tRNA glutamyl-Q(34) synthetase GluQRS [Rubricoccaceae bacterium]|nr:tRNA glutamyl-Q(34) synthetase GluQRS [Rubricoccaceae bacterium]